MGRTDKAIVVGRRVSARRGPFLALLPGQRRQQRARIYGCVTESVSANEWKVSWDGGVVTTEKSAALRVEYMTAGREVIDAAATSFVVNARPIGIPESYIPIPSTECAPSELLVPSSGFTYSNDVVPPSVSDSMPSGTHPATASMQTDGSSGQASSVPGTLDCHPWEDLDSGSSDDDDPEPSGLTLHPLVAAGLSEDLAHTLGRLVGETHVSGGITWTVVQDVTEATTVERSQRLPEPGLKGGLPTKDSDVDLLGLWLKMYPGDMQDDINRINAQGLRQRYNWKLITQREFVTFWGLIIGASQFHQKGKCMWTNSARRGIRDPPRFDCWMKQWRFNEIRNLLKYAKADLSKVPSDPWAWFRRAVDDFNLSRKAVLQHGLVVTLDESMSAWKPRADKFGGLPNISFIMRKPKPLGTEFKAACDATTGIMMHLEIQEGRDAMRQKTHAADLGVTSACVQRIATEACAPGSTICGDSWFSSVKVSK